MALVGNDKKLSLSKSIAQSSKQPIMKNNYIKKIQILNLGQFEG